MYNNVSRFFKNFEEVEVLLEYYVEYELPCFLLPTEQHDPIQVEILIDKIKEEEVWTTPILVDKKTLAIMDGHHRRAAALKLNLVKVPVVKLSYDDPRVILSGWREDVFSPEEIIAAAVSGLPLPFKSTKHDLVAPLPRLQLPLQELLPLN